MSKRSPVLGCDNLSFFGRNASLLNAGLDVSNARIVTVNGQPVITADTPAPEGSNSSVAQPLNLPGFGPASAPSTPVQIPHSDPWNNAAIIGGVASRFSGGRETLSPTAVG